MCCCREVNVYWLHKVHRNAPDFSTLACWWQKMRLRMSWPWVVLTISLSIRYVQLCNVHCAIIAIVSWRWMAIGRCHTQSQYFDKNEKPMCAFVGGPLALLTMECDGCEVVSSGDWWWSRPRESQEGQPCLASHSCRHWAGLEGQRSLTTVRHCFWPPDSTCLYQ